MSNSKIPNSRFNIHASGFKIPYLSIPDAPIVSTTQDFIPLADVTEDIAIFKDGGAAVIMESTSLNFSLLSEKEQQAVIFAYAALLNSLSFPIEIMIRSQIKDISRYKDYLDKARQKITNPMLGSVMDTYKKFVSETIKKKNVLGKSFYIVIPFSPLEFGVAKSAKAITKRAGPLPFPKSYAIKKAKVALYPKRDHLIRQAKRLGITLKQLSTGQIIELFYNVFNSDPPSIKKEEDAKKDQDENT
jgi:hypothetical protein